jgi:uncharacterized protein (DUF1697 family)
MPVIVSMLRGVNLGPHHRIKMDALRELYESLGLQDVKTYVQSGNVIFRTSSRSLSALSERIANAIEKRFGFGAEVILRSTADLRAVIARNPFAARPGIDPRKLLVTFLVHDPDPQGRAKVLQMKTDPEELCIDGREVYIYFANGMARPKLSWTQVATMLKTSGTGRNWNTVQALLEIAESLEPPS